MFFKIRTLGSTIQHKVYEIPFEDETCGLHDLMRACNELWRGICEDRDREIDRTVQHRLMDYPNATVQQYARMYVKDWFSPVNAINFVRALIEWADEYLPYDIGAKALQECIFSYDIGAASKRSLCRKTIPHEKALVFSRADACLFSRDFIPAKMLKTDVRKANFAINFAHSDRSPYGAMSFDDCQRSTMKVYRRLGLAEMPIILLNNAITRAFVYRYTENPFRGIHRYAVPSLYLTLTMYMKVQYPDESKMDPIEEMKMIWPALEDMSYTDPFEYANLLEHLQENVLTEFKGIQYMIATERNADLKSSSKTKV